MKKDTDMENNNHKKNIGLYKKDIPFPCTLEEGLNILTKDTLQKIRKSYNFYKMSSLSKKDLANKLAEGVSYLIMLNVHFFNIERYDLVKKSMDNGGIIYNPDLRSCQIEYFMNKGLFIPGKVDGKAALVMPVEIQKSLKGINDRFIYEKVKFNSEFISLVNGMLYYYGVIDYKSLIDMLETYISFDPDTLNYFEILWHEHKYNFTINLYLDYCAHIEAAEHSEIYKEQNIRADIPYFRFSKNKLLAASKEGFIERTPQFMNLLNFILDNFGVNKEFAEDFLDDCMMMIKWGESTKELLEYFGNVFEIPSMQFVNDLMPKLNHLYNTTKQWFLKGYSANELFTKYERKHLKPLTKKKHEETNVVDIKTGAKIGRNHPCPCGSGKKFKKCCLGKE